ncbi:MULTISPECIES: RHS repeat-associated core domain-containing protein [unclassified Kitasatospora]|uniref:RHS repeat-associated core domain-containing protein n=1 Tax=unclassified Kitasatospora TaxID=2633591 RepID=UPI00070D1CDF|nr:MULTISPECIES: RHS repeat-associated core domain-containing protein [unclassified Kitasatospora]KQV15524.1 hypothetical protein ASC99_08045 [Kitasatospora sp. Root107]KRB63889.1 hypothetical protein ASE03_04820 [Kitasatospora sp. Root187]
MTTSPQVSFAATPHPSATPDHRIPSKPFPLKDGRASAIKGQLPGARPKAAAWPSASAADVQLDVKPSAGVPLSLRSAGPGAVAAPRAAAGSPKIHVQLHDRATASQVGVNGVLLSLTPADASAVGPMEATLDYSAFRDAGGADFGGRLRLVQLPACALTTPQVPACQVQTPITGSRNDTAHSTLTTQIQAPAPAPAKTASPFAARTVAAPSMVMAAVPGSSGTGGDFTATSLSPSGTWSAGGSTGGFTWTYPIAVPPVAAGAAPNVALSYSSSSIDGRTGTTNNQSSWIGEGWEYSPGFVERTYRSCSALTDLPTASQTGDQCWAGQILTLSLNGKSDALVYDDTTHTLHAQSDSGDRVEMLTGSSNGALNGEYFKVTTTDGTQYFFGRNSGPGYTNQGTTNSTWTAPVYGAHSGDPCYSSAGFSSSACTQGWRWNLDYVEDIHGNASMYYYTPETNQYGQNNSTTGTNYVRGGYLNRIDYGLRSENGTVYAAPAADQIVFTTAERCTPDGSFSCDPSQMTAANATKWPDVPVDQQCTSGTTCNTHSPTFWSTKRLTNITTQYTNGSGGYTKVDSYNLDQAFPPDADPELWLTAIKRTGYDKTGASIPMLPITFYGQAMVNRVLDYTTMSGMPHWRLTSISTDTGGVIGITYSTTCSKATIPADPSQNTSQCMPTYWTPPRYSEPILDYFNKYVVAEVDIHDPSGLTPMQKTMYSYIGAAAWHFDDNEVVKPANRTYGQFRGYGEVHTKTGNASNGEQLTKAATTYFRGMNGDTLPNNGIRTAAVTNSLGESVNDDGALVGQAFEATSYNGDGGARLSRTFTDPVVLATTATRNRDGLKPLTANLVQVAKSRTLTDLAAGGVRTVTTTSGYDSTGRVTRKDESGDAVPELCTVTTYADNTTNWVRNRASEVIISQQACPPVGTAQSNIQADTRTYYDGSSTLGALPGAGDPTKVETLNNGSFFTSATNTYDSSGRVASSGDALGRTTSAVYTPAAGGVLTQTVSTNPLGQKTTTVLAPDRGGKVSVTDVAGHVTSGTYDALGRLTQVWKPGRTQGQVTPSHTYSYLMQVMGPQVVTANDLVDYGTGTNYVMSTKLFDALGRTVQTQVTSENGGSQVTDTFYDGHGWTVATNNHYLISEAPSGIVRQVAIDSVDDRTVNTLDGSGRITTATAYRSGAVTKTSQTVYGGDRTTTIPPQGGTIETVVTDARGRNIELDQYTSAPTVNGSVVSGGSFQPTVYGYDALGRQTSLQSGGFSWSFTLDTLGRRTGQQDPDTGSSSSAFDNAGQLSSSTDSRGQTLAYTYDLLGRRTALYSGSTSGTKLASWLYDTLQAGKLTNATRYTTNGNYVTGTTGYDGAGNAISQLTVVPAYETGLNKTYITRYGYSSTNLLLTVTPAPVTGMPAEIINNTYDQLGNPVKVHGTSVMASQSLTGYGLPSQVTYGGSTNNAKLSYTYDLQTLKVKKASLTAQVAVPQLDDTEYQYNEAGQLTSVTDTRGPKGTAPVDNQCFRYDALGRLNTAWTAAADCTNDPTSAGNSVIGGPNPYWTTWTFDAAGDRLSQVAHTLPGAGGSNVTTTYNYTAGGHRLAGTTGGAAGPTGYTYDNVGHTLTRALPTGSQTIVWNEEGKPSSLTGPGGLTSWIYTPEGKELLRRDPGSTTLYLPGQEITRTSGGVVTTKRYYSLGALTVGVSDGTTAGTCYLVGDLHNSQQLSVNTTTLALARRSMDPYGNLRGTTTGGTWPDNHGFLDMPLSPASGLTEIGAREYDPTIGKFISVDPDLNIKDPQSLTGYTYTNNNPTNASDPSGLRVLENSDDAWIGEPASGTTFADTTMNWGGTLEDVNTDNTNAGRSNRYLNYQTLVDWAQKHGDEEIDTTTGDNCTNFVSDALAAAGMPGKWDGKSAFRGHASDTPDQWWNGSDWIPDWISGLTDDQLRLQKRSKTWTVAGGLFNFLESTGSYEVPVSKAAPGDLMFWEYADGSKGGKPGEIHHAAVITGLQPGEILYSQHSGKRSNAPLSKIEPDMSRENGPQVIRIVRVSPWPCENPMAAC